MIYTATQMEAPEGLTIAGIVLSQFRDNLARDITDPIMDKHSLINIDNEVFYSAKIMDEIYREIFYGTNGQQILVAMGKASATTTLDFIKPKSPNDILDNIHNVFTAYLRNMPEGFGMIVKKLDDRKFEVWNNTQVPNDLIYGFLWECLRQTRGEDNNFLIIPLADYNRDSAIGARFEVSWDT